MLVSCKNAKSGSRAFKRTNSEVFSIKTRWERPIWKFEIFTDFHFFLKKIEIFDKITKNHRISNWSVSANFYRKHFRVGAFERPWPIWSGKTKSFCINRIKPPVNLLKPLYGRKVYKNVQNRVTIQMLTDAREMLGNARKLQKRQEWVQGFQTHQLWSAFDKNSLRTANLKILDFDRFSLFFEKSWFFENL